MVHRVPFNHRCTQVASRRSAAFWFQPRAHKINHATALGGRLTVKTLTLLLDQEALAPPCRNKAELLCEGPPSTLGGDDGGALLTLFR